MTTLKNERTLLEPNDVTETTVMSYRLSRPRPQASSRRTLAWCAASALFALGLGLASPAAAVQGQVELIPEAAQTLASPPLPPLATYPLQLVLDDDQPEAAFGVLEGQGAKQFFWFNRFTRPAGFDSFSLREIWVLFPQGAAAVGDVVDLAVLLDPDGNPANGATLLGTFTETVEAADGTTFSTYVLDPPLAVSGAGDVLIGAVNRWVVSGVTPPANPATLDLTASQGRSWFAVWSGNPPAGVNLEGAVLVQRIDDFDPQAAGNWLVRGFGTSASTVEVPTLGTWGLLALVGALALGGLVMLRRRNPLALLALLALAGFGSPAAAQTTIDSFTTNQTALSEPPASPGSTVTGGADILGTRRGLFPRLLAGAGPATVSVGGGSLTLLVTATTPDSRGSATLTWDGDTNATTLSPTGLGGLNLTTGNVTGFRIRVTSTSAPATDLLLRVYTNGTDFSSAAKVLGPLGSVRDVFIPFSELRAAGGAGATLTNVGAVQLVITAGEGTAIVDEIVTALPVLAATKVDALTTDVDLDTRADPGDTVTYTITITNTGSEATSVTLADMVDANTTLVASSVASTPIARPDQYRAVGNVPLAADGSPGRPGLVANDQDPDGDALSVQSVVSPTVRGGTVTLVDAATGTFTYAPPPGFEGVDAFNYTLQDADGGTSVTTASISVEGVVWFVDDSNTTAPFLGTLTDPFQSLAAVSGAGGAGDADAPGHILFLFDDDGVAYGGGLELEADQRFFGEAEGLILNGQTIVPAGGRPQLTHAAGNGILLSTNNTLRGFEVTGTSGAGIRGTSVGTVTISNSSVTNAGGSALDITTGTLAVTVSGLSSLGTAGQRGVNLDGVSGTLNVTGATSLTNPSTQGLRIANSPSLVADFGNTTVNDNVIGSAPAATAIDLATGNAGLIVGFTSLVVVADGAGLVANNSGMIVVNGTTNSIVATSGPAVDVTSTSLGGGATFTTVSSTNSSGKGINLDTVAGSFVANGGSIANPAGVAFDLNAGSGTVTYAGSISNTAAARLIEVTNRTGGATNFSGTLSASSSSQGILVQNNATTGTPSITFSGSAKVLNTGANAAITLDNNDVATITFSGGGLDVDTTSGTAFNVINGASAVNVTGTNNTLTATTGSALNVVASNIGASGMTFRSIASNGGSAIGINLDGTGTAGGLTVTGTGSAGSGGTIANKSGADGSTTAGIGVFLRNTSNVRLARMQLNDFQNSGIVGRSVQGFELTDSVISGVIGTSSAEQEGPVVFGLSNPSGTNGLQGTGLFRNIKVSGGLEHNLEFYNQSGNMNLTVEGVGAVSEGANPNSPADDVADCIIEENSLASGGDGIQIEMQNTSTATIVVDRCLFRDNKSQAIQVSALNDSVVSLTIDESFARRFDQGNEGFLVSNGGNADLTVLMSNSRANNYNGVGFFVGQVPGNATAASTLHATLTNNIVNQPTTATNHGILAFLTSTVGQVSNARLRIDGNMVVNNSTSGTTRGILVDVPDTSTSPKFDVTVTNNSVSVGDNVAGVAGLVVQSRQSADGCANIGGNTVTFPNGTPGGVQGLRARQVSPATYDLESSASCTGTAASVLTCRNPASTTEVLGTLTVVPAGTCLLPALP